MAPRTSQPQDQQRQLMIKTKTCQRLIKEVDFYGNEVTENEQKLQEMIDQARDPYDIKKFREVVGESRMMVPDAKKRLEQSLEDLKEFLASTSSTLEGEWSETARTILAEYSKSDQDLSRVQTSVAGLDDGDVF